VLTQQYLDTLLARVAAGEQVAITTALTHAIQGK
jgi:antitoxin (DNA-binding transcriptional repressor) of toxin-antitoxin stability system